MRARERLADLLSEALGFPVNEDDLQQNRGYWSHRQQDVYRWQAEIRVPPDRDAEFTANDDPSKPWKRIHMQVLGHRTEHISLACWETMTECARKGIRLERDEWTIIVSPKS